MPPLEASGMADLFAAADAPLPASTSRVDEDKRKRARERAAEYVEKFEIRKVLQDMFQKVIRERPPDPIGFMQGFLSSNKGQGLEKAHDPAVLKDLDEQRALVAKFQGELEATKLLHKKELEQSEATSLALEASKKDLDERQKVIDKLQAQVKELQELKGPQPAGGGAEPSGEVEALRTKVQDLEARGAQALELQSTCETLRALVKALEARLEGSDERQRVIDDLRARVQDLEPRARAAEERQAELNSLRLKMQELQARASQAEELQVTCETLRARAKELEARTGGPDERQKVIDDLRAQVQELAPRAKAAEEQQAELLGLRKKVQELASAQAADAQPAELADLRRKVQELEARLLEQQLQSTAGAAKELAAAPSPDKDSASSQPITDMVQILNSSLEMLQERVKELETQLEGRQRIIEGLQLKLQDLGGPASQGQATSIEDRLVSVQNSSLPGKDPRAAEVGAQLFSRLLSSTFTPLVHTERTAAIGAGNTSKLPALGQDPLVAVEVFNCKDPDTNAVYLWVGDIKGRPMYRSVAAEPRYLHYAEAEDGSCKCWQIVDSTASEDALEVFPEPEGAMQPCDCTQGKNGGRAKAADITAEVIQSIPLVGSPEEKVHMRQQLKRVFGERFVQMDAALCGMQSSLTPVLEVAHTLEAQQRAIQLITIRLASEGRRREAAERHAATMQEALLDLQLRVQANINMPVHLMSRMKEPAHPVSPKELQPSPAPAFRQVGRLGSGVGDGGEVLLAPSVASGAVSKGVEMEAAGSSSTRNTTSTAAAAQVVQGGEAEASKAATSPADPAAAPSTAAEPPNDGPPKADGTAAPKAQASAKAPVASTPTTVPPAAAPAASSQQDASQAKPGAVQSTAGAKSAAAPPAKSAQEAATTAEGQAGGSTRAPAAASAPPKQPTTARQEPGASASVPAKAPAAGGPEGTETAAKATPAPVPPTAQTGATAKAPAAAKAAPAKASASVPAKAPAAGGPEGTETAAKATPAPVPPAAEKGAPAKAPAAKGAPAKAKAAPEPGPEPPAASAEQTEAAAKAPTVAAKAGAKAAAKPKAAPKASEAPGAP